MMVVGAVERSDVQRHPAVHGKSLEPFLHQFGIEAADLVAHELCLEHQQGATGNVDGHARECLVHGHVHIGITGDAFHVSQRLLHGLAERDPDIFGGVVVINVEIARGLHRDVHAGMACQQIEHMIEEADSGRDGRVTAAVELDLDRDVGLLGDAFDEALAHAFSGLGGRLLSRVHAFRHCRAICAFAPQCLDHVLARKAPMQSPLSDSWHGTTILTVRKNGSAVIGGDGQVTIGQTIVKANAKKVRRLGKGDVIGGFAGATADAFTLFERLEAKLEQYPGQLTRAAVELAKDWRTDRYLRRLEAMMIVADTQVSLVLTGTGDVLEPEAGIMGIGSGGNYALAAARAMIDGPLDAEAIVRKAMDIAAEICVYTNRNITVEKL